MSRKRPREGTKAREEWELKKLRNMCLKLWKQVVKVRAGNNCEICGDSKRLNAHHIEDYKLCFALRYDPQNGVASCPKHHKFGQDAFHKSFIFTYEFMIKNRPLDLEYLKWHKYDKIEINKKYLVKQIKVLSGLLEVLSKGV